MQHLAVVVIHEVGVGVLLVMCIKGVKSACPQCCQQMKIIDQVRRDNEKKNLIM